MDTQRAAEIQVVLEGIDLPATRRALIDYASREDASVVDDLRRIPDREYRRLDEVGDELLGSPAKPAGKSRLPKPESGAPPGGSAYTHDGEAGRVRDDAPPDNPPPKAVEQQTKTQKRQQANQSS